MKYYFLLLIFIFTTCKNEKTISEIDNVEFVKMAQEYQKTYMEGGKNCEQILAAMDNDIKMWENGKVWSLADLKKFCSHLPTKKVIETHNSQKLLDHGLGYDYVSQLYISQTGDTLRETASRIWKKTDQSCKFVKMNNLLKKE